MVQMVITLHNSTVAYSVVLAVRQQFLQRKVGLSLLPLTLITLNEVLIVHLAFSVEQIFHSVNTSKTRAPLWVRSDARPDQQIGQSDVRGFHRRKLLDTEIGKRWKKRCACVCFSLSFHGNKMKLGIGACHVTIFSLASKAWIPGPRCCQRAHCVCHIFRAFGSPKLSFLSLKLYHDGHISHTVMLSREFLTA